MAEPHPQPPAHWGGSEPRRILAPDGSVVGAVPDDLDTSALRELYRWMVLARRLDRECIALQRQGELTVYPGHEGQEAAQVGSAWALGADDFVWPTFRELPVALIRGVDAVAVPPVPPRHVARRSVRPARDPLRADLHPDRDPDRPRGRVRARPAARRQRRRDDRVLRRRRDQRGRLPRGCEPGRGTPRCRSFCSARTTAGRSAFRPRRRRRARSGAAPRGMGSRACGSTGTTCSRCTRSRAKRSTARGTVKARR